MRVVLQRVSSASVSVDDAQIASIGRGLLILLGVAAADTAADAGRVARKCAELRIFPDDEGRFNRSLLEIGGQALVVSQFTLLADVRRGRRPSFAAAAPPDAAQPIVDAFVSELRGAGVQAETGRFGARMAVELVNDGPVTIILDSGELERPRRANKP